MADIECLKQPRITETLKTLVAVDTCQPQGNEKLLINKILNMLPPDIDFRIIEHTDKRASLIVKLPGRSQKDGLAIIGHMDTVAFGDIKQWQFDPLSGKEIDGRIYGRGTADMKAGLAAMISVIKAIIENNFTLLNDLYFCFTADEESKGIGAQALAKLEELKNVRELIIAEPSDGKIGIAEKGVIWLKLTAHGMLAHGSRPELGINAIEKAMLFEERLRKLIKNDKVHPLLGKTTISVTGFNGGIMTNVIPETAIMEMDIRILPSVDMELLISNARKIADQIVNETPKLILDLEQIEYILKNHILKGDFDKEIAEDYAEITMQLDDLKKCSNSLISEKSKIIFDSIVKYVNDKQLLNT